MGWNVNVRWLMTLLGLILFLTDGQKIDLPHSDAMIVDGEMVTFGKAEDGKFYHAFSCKLSEIRYIAFYSTWGV
jgi:hypothetical protein